MSWVSLCIIQFGDSEFMNEQAALKSISPYGNWHHMPFEGNFLWIYISCIHLGPLMPSAASGLERKHHSGEQAREGAIKLTNGRLLNKS